MNIPPRFSASEYVFGVTFLVRLILEPHFQFLYWYCSIEAYINMSTKRAYWALNN